MIESQSKAQKTLILS